MKAVALILALAVITGCHARAVRQAEAVSSTAPWEETLNRFWQRVSSLENPGNVVIENIKTSQLSRELDTLITDTTHELSVYMEDVKAKLSPYTDTTVTQVSDDLSLLGDKLLRDMSEAKERTIEYVNDLKTTVEHNGNDMRGRISADTNKLRKGFFKGIGDFWETANIYAGEIKSRATQNLQSAKDRFEPYVQQASDTATKKLIDISTLLRTQAEGLGQQLETQAEGIKTQLEATAQELRTAMEGKIDELTGLLSPVAIKLREQVEGIVDTVKETASS